MTQAESTPDPGRENGDPQEPHREPEESPEVGHAAGGNEAPRPAVDGEPDDELEAARARARKERENALRATAELENYRRRAAREMENARRFALERFMQDLLDVRDSLERGLEVGEQEQATVEQLIEGTQLTFRLLDKALSAHGLEVIDPVGEPFDPERHEAMSMVPSAEHAPDTVVTVVQKGFLLNERLLRPARVLVASAPA